MLNCCIFLIHIKVKDMLLAETMIENHDGQTFPSLLDCLKNKVRTQNIVSEDDQVQTDSKSYTMKLRPVVS